MQHSKLDDDAIKVISLLGESFYRHVPLEYRTYCSLTSRISQRVLEAFSIPAELKTCQVWYVTAEHNFVVGFLGQHVPGKWNGHVMCVAGDFFIDAALHHFKRDFGVAVPDVAVSRTFGATTTVISRVNLSADRRLWWHEPPRIGFDTTPPDEPEDVISGCASALITAIAAQRDGAQPRVANKT